ncbi:hypothetical protein CDEF62S_03531 [Castellaniella defragrans]
MDTPISFVPEVFSPEDLRLGVWKVVQEVWSPYREAWWLIHDRGVQVPLTRAEHAVLACLYRSPGRWVPGEVLVQAVLRTWSAPPHRQRRTTVDIRVVLGRLRTKARRVGLVLPVQCVATRYCWWTGPSAS